MLLAAVIKTGDRKWLNWSGFKTNAHITRCLEEVVSELMQWIKKIRVQDQLLCHPHGFPLRNALESQRPFLIQPSVKAGRRARFLLLHISEAGRKSFSWSCLADIFLRLIEDNCQIPFPKPITCRGNGIPIIGLNQSSFILWAGKHCSLAPELPE